MYKTQAFSKKYILFGWAGKQYTWKLKYTILNTWRTVWLTTLMGNLHD